MKVIKHIRQDFHLTAWGWDLGVLWVVKGQKKFSEIQPDLVCEFHVIT